MDHVSNPRPRRLLLVALLAASLGCDDTSGGPTADADAAGAAGEVTGDVVDSASGGDTASGGDASDAHEASSSDDAGSGDASASDAKDASADDAAVDTSPPPAFAVALTAPYAGQLHTAGGSITASASLTGPATTLTAATLAWSLEDADGGNKAAVAGAQTSADSGGKATATLTPPVGVRRLRVVANSGAESVDAARELVVCPTAASIVSVDGELPAEAMLGAGGAVKVVATVDGVVGPGASLELRSDLDGKLAEVALAPVASEATTKVELLATPSAAGSHGLSLHLRGGTGPDAVVCPALGSVTVQVCGGEIKEDFAKALTGSAWKTSGDASWDAGGWLELTGNAQSKGGAVYNQALYVQPGDVRMTLRIATGGGMNGGADGFAMTILEAKSPGDVDAYLAKTGNGGCLGYGVSGTCGSTKVEAFHVEIDTWVNKGDPNTDPPGITGNNGVMGSGNHIAVHTDGDAGNALLWLPESGKPAISVEDLTWHTVTIAVQGDTLTIRLDDTVKASKKVAGLDFRGGYVIFSGSTGWASNFHRIDDLRILHQCN